MTAPAPPENALLKRSLRLWDLVLFAIVLIQLAAPMPVFCVLHKVSPGHVVSVILPAMVATLFTSISYGSMAHAFPGGSSSFLCVGICLGGRLIFSY